MRKATFAFIPDLTTQNIVAALAWRCHLEYSAGIEVRRLPPHLSLKQPFDAPEVTNLVAYMGTLAKSIEPFHVVMENLQVWSMQSDDVVNSGILTVKIKENAYLRQLHDRLNVELAQRFGECPAEFDGDSYSPHITVAAGGPSIDIYQGIARREQEINSMNCRLEALGLFVYEKSMENKWTYMTYRLDLLGG